MRKRSVSLAAALVIGLPLLMLSATGAYPVAADDDSAHINQCKGSGTKGLYSGHSNEQICFIGFYACVGNAMNDPGFGGLPPGTQGVIMIPWGESWHLTGGNYGYVGNVCNGNAGIANVITYSLSGFNQGEQWPFSRHLEVMQHGCGGRCEARLMSYSTSLQLWSDNTLHLRDDPWSPVNHHSIHFHLASLYLANGPIYWDGYTVNSYGQGTFMGAPGYGSLMSQTVLAQDDVNQWEVFKDGIAQKAPELVGEGLKSVAEAIFIASWMWF